MQPRLLIRRKDEKSVGDEGFLIDLISTLSQPGDKLK